MQKHLAIASLSILIFLTSSSLVAGKNTCSEYVAWPYFNPSSLVGTWYMYAINSDGGAITGSRCEHIEFTKLNNNDLTYIEYGVDGSNTPSYGTFKTIEQAHFAKSSNLYNGTRRYNTVARDPDYYIVYTCQMIDGKPAETNIIYTREAEPSEAVIKNMVNREYRLYLSDYKLVDQKNCQ